MHATLEPLFRQGTLIRPTDDQPNLVHLTRALGSLAGVPELDHSPPTRTVKDVIGPADHLIFVLLDGLGMSTVRRLPSDTLIASSVRMTLNATCPSTTACALTSVTTAQYPNRHAVAGWFTYLPEFNLTAMILPFAERLSGEPLTRRGIRAEDVLPCRPICPRMSHRPLTLVPANIANTTYNVYTRGSAPGVGYTSIHHAVDEIIARVKTAAGPTYTHLYLPEVDTLCHHVGVEHPKVVPLVMSIDAELRRLVDGLRGHCARLVVSADHGLIDVPKEHQTILEEGDPLLDTLRLPPTGDARMPVFHVREGRREAFLGQFDDRFGRQMALVDLGTAEQMQLFGPGPFSDVARPRFGDFIAFPYVPASLGYHPPNKPRGEPYLALHAGLSPEEMIVPLCVI